MRKISKQSSATLVELPPTQFGVYNGDPGYDLYSKFRLPARALHALEAVLRRDGWRDVQTVNPLYHGRNKRLTEENECRIFKSDILGVSAITRTSPQTMELIRKYKLANPNGIAIAGGFDPTFRAEAWLKAGADFVVVGEGEITLSLLAERLTQEQTQFSDIDGLAFRKGKELFFTPKRSLMTSDELGSLPLPHYDLQTRKGVKTGVVETTRGCPNACEFCSVTEFYGRKYRMKPLDHVVEGIKEIKDMGRIVFFTDDNFIASPSRAIELCERIANKGIYRGNSLAQATIKAAENPKLLTALKEAGVDVLCVGIESLNDKTLKIYGKPYTAEQNKKNIKTLREAGFWVHGMMIVGGDGDTPESLEEDFEWMKRNLDSIQLFSQTAFPGSEFFRKMSSEGRILTEDYSLYDGQNVTVRPMHFSPFELQKRTEEMYKEFYSFKESFKRWKTTPLRGMALGLYLYTHIFGGLNNTLYSPQAIQHAEFLKSAK